MTDDEKKRLHTFAKDLTRVSQELKDYFDFRDTSMSNIVAKAFIDGMNVIVENVRSDVSFLSDDIHLNMNFDDNKQVLVTNLFFMIMCNIQDMFKYIEDKKEIQSKSLIAYLDDVISMAEKIKKELEN